MAKKIRIPRTNDLRERDGWRRSQDDDNDKKVDKVPTAIEDNIPVFDNDGGLKDSGNDFDDLIFKKPSAVENNIATFDSAGDVVDSGIQKTEFDLIKRRSYFYGRAY